MCTCANPVEFRSRDVGHGKGHLAVETISVALLQNPDSDNLALLVLNSARDRKFDKQRLFLLIWLCHHPIMTERSNTRILRLLKSRGAQNAEAIARYLKITAVAAVTFSSIRLSDRARSV